jgi:hypothetical protein
MMYIRYPLSLRNTEDLLAERFCRLGLDGDVPITRLSPRTDMAALERAICCASFSRP